MHENKDAPLLATDQAQEQWQPVPPPQPQSEPPDGDGLFGFGWQPVLPPRLQSENLQPEPARASPSAQVPGPAVDPASRRIVTLAPDGTGDYASLEQAVAAVCENETIRLLPGEYRLAATLVITKSISLQGAGMDETAIVGCSGRAVIAYAAAGPFTAAAITFRYEGLAPADLITANQGAMAITCCRFSGGVANGKGEYGGHGLLLSGQATGRVAHCVAENNGGCGLAIHGQARPHLEENLCRGNKGSGIGFFDDSAGVAHKNRCTANAQSGFAVQGRAQPTLDDNRCDRNQAPGIVFAGYARGCALKNQCTGNWLQGILVQQEAAPRLEQNQCLQNRGHGIQYSGHAGGTAQGNRCEQNGCPFEAFAGCDGSGIWVAGGGPIIAANRCCNNRSYGILVSEGTSARLLDNQCNGNAAGNLKDRRGSIAANGG